MTIRLHAGELVIFGLDCTGSMLTKDVLGFGEPGGQSRFDYAKERIKGAVEMVLRERAAELDLVPHPEANDIGPVLVPRTPARRRFSPMIIGFGNGIQYAPVDVGEHNLQQHLDQFSANHALCNLHELIFAAHHIRDDMNAAQTTLIAFIDGLPSEQAAAIASLHMALDEPEKRFEVHLLTVGEPEASLTSWLASLKDRLGSSSARVLISRAETMGFEYASASATQQVEQRAQATGKREYEPPRVRSEEPAPAPPAPSSAPPTTPPRGRRPAPR